MADMQRWTASDSEELYQVPQWGLGHFGVSDEGHLVVHTDRGDIDLNRVADEAALRGIALPLLVRLGDVLRQRIDALARTFAQAISEAGYEGVFRGVYPIKVNQQRHIVDDIVRYSRPHHLGLECGSKPELLLVLARLSDPEALIICNGYKDAEYIQMALLARKLGRRTVIVIEQLDEVPLVIRMARELDVEPVLGVRAKLASRGAGKWKSSTGDRAKFGLTAREVVDAVRALDDAELLGSLKLLHFHIGSQVSAIRSFRNALREGARVYSELCRLGAPMGILDVGGGLGVDYDGSRTNFESSMNYDLKEYASTVVSTIQERCDEDGLPHPTLVTESGRAMVAHSSVLVVPVMAVNSLVEAKRPQRPEAEAPDSVSQLWTLYSDLSRKNLVASWHEAIAVKEETLTRFNLGLATLDERADVDRLFWQVGHRILGIVREDDEEAIHEELQDLPRTLADTYFCNFSVFQSVPDSWAIGQLFPIVPLSRLAERPKRRGVLVDITCDSDGQIDTFIDRRDVRRVLELHEPNGQPYRLGVFLVGAYQEILGDLHNLFGDTNTVHVLAADTSRGYRIEHFVEGDRVDEVLRYVQFDHEELVDSLRRNVEEAYENGSLTMEEGVTLMKTYARGMRSYTYLAGD